LTGLSPRGFLSLTAAMPLRVVEGASKFIEGASLYKTFTIGLSPVRKQASLASLEEMHSPFGGWRHHLSAPVGSMSLDWRVAGLPYESSSFATPTSWGHYKAPLCCELLMKGLFCGSLLSHRSAGGKWCRKTPKGGKPPEVADRCNAFHAIWHRKPIP